ncbi:MAG: DUF4349 domain-containing protein [Candidatus Coatesbacteria bacterium]|nr:DUF4349 domain-containing protein [Candidatus Coatesbacteria bacterium]
MSRSAISTALLLIAAAAACGASYTYEVELELALDDFKEGLAAVRALLTDGGANLLTSRTEDDDDEAFAELEYELPADDSRALVRRLKGLGVVLGERSELEQVGEGLTELEEAVRRLGERVAELREAVDEPGLEARERIDRQRELTRLEDDLDTTRRRLDELRHRVEFHELHLVLVEGHGGEFDELGRLIFTIILPALVIVILAFFLGLRIGRLRERGES